MNNLTRQFAKPGGHFGATDEDTVDLVRRPAAHHEDAKMPSSSSASVGRVSISRSGPRRR